MNLYSRPRTPEEQAIADIERKAALAHLEMMASPEYWPT
jgi:hypothetical protein